MYTVGKSVRHSVPLISKVVFFKWTNVPFSSMCGVIGKFWV